MLLLLVLYKPLVIRLPLKGNSLLNLSLSNALALEVYDSLIAVTSIPICLALLISLPFNLLKGNSTKC